MPARQRPHRWQAAAVALGGEPPLAADGSAGTHQQKSNEIPAIKPLLRKLPKAALEGSLITADALHCQQETAAFITQELGADYLFGLKGNQSGIWERAQIKLTQDGRSEERRVGK